MTDSFDKFASRVASAHNQPAPAAEKSPARHPPRKPVKSRQIPQVAQHYEIPAQPCDCMAPHGCYWLTPFKQWKCCNCDPPAREGTARMLAMRIVATAGDERERWKDCEEPPKPGEWFLVPPGSGQREAMFVVDRTGKVRSLAERPAEPEGWRYPWPVTGPATPAQLQAMLEFDCDKSKSRAKFTIDFADPRNWKYLLVPPADVNFDTWWEALPKMLDEPTKADHVPGKVMNAREANIAIYGDKRRGRRR